MVDAMIRQLCCIGMLLAVGMAANAQQAQPLNVRAERERIDIELRQHEIAFAQAERQCYQRFAVTDCLRAARMTRRLALDDLRRQEVVLNDLERKERAAQALQRIQERISNQDLTTPVAR